MKLLLLFLLTGNLAAAVYYVDSCAGSDSNNGQSVTSAWKSIAKVNGSAFAPGDSVLFKRGCYWREQLSISSSGASGSLLLFGAYGTGINPVIAGSDVMSGWRSVGNSTYVAPQAISPKNIYVDGGDPVPAAPNLSATVGKPGAWWYDPAGGLLYLHLGDSSAPDGHYIEASVRPYGILAQGTSYVAVTNLEIRQVTLSGILITNQDPSGSEYWQITNCNIHNAAETGIYIHPSDIGNPPMLRGWVVQNNRIGRIDSDGSVNYDRAGILCRGTVGALIQGNNVATVNNYGIRVADYFGKTPSTDATIDSNTLGMNQGNISIAFTPNVVVSNNTIRNSSGYGIGIGGSGTTNALVTNNVIQNLGPSNATVLYNGFDCNAGASGGKLLHNTVVAVTHFSMTLESDADQPCNGWLVENNIFDARHNSALPLVPNESGAIYMSNNVTGTVFVSNNLLPSATFLQGLVRIGGGLFNFNTWSSAVPAGTVSGNISQDPQFVNEATGNLQLQVSSPCLLAMLGGTCGWKPPANSQTPP